jgi:hypothetical protein
MAEYAFVYLNKIDSFKKQTKTRKAVFLSFISTYGLIDYENKGMVQNEIVMDYYLFYLIKKAPRNFRGFCVIE